MQRFRWMVAMIAIAMVAGTSPALAQGLAIGGKLGATFANVGGEGVEGTSSKTGLSIGAFASIGVSPMFSLQPELLFVQKGTSIEEEGLGSFSASYSYLEVPVLARISFPTPGAFKPHLFVGPSLSFQMGCSVGAEFDGLSADADCDALEEEGLDGSGFGQTKSFDFGVIGGLGAGMAVGPGQATLDVRYNLGLSGIYDAPEGATDVTSVKNRAFTVMLGYSIGLGG